MSVITHKDQARLRLGFDGSSLDAAASGRNAGVLVWGEREVLPVGAVVHARVDRPTLKQPSFDPADHVIPATQGYVVEQAVWVNRARSLAVEPATPGRFVVRQEEPAWATLAVGAVPLVPEGTQPLQIVMPGAGTDDRRLLRFRWEGTAAVAVILQALAGGETVVSGSFAEQNLVPGSIVLTFPGPFTVRDNGDGRLVGLGGGGERFDGTVNYLTGEYEINLDPAAVAGNLLATYEHSCSYAPLDVQVEWDALMAM